MKRTDIHSPKNIITENYDFVCVRSHGNGFEDAEFNQESIRQFNAHRAATGGIFSQHSHGGCCMVCGSWFIDYAIFHHVPSNEYIQCGMDCAAHIEDGHDDAFKRHAQLRRAAAKRTKMAAKASEILDELNILSFVESMYEGGEFLGTIHTAAQEIPVDASRITRAKKTISFFVSSDVMDVMTPNAISSLESKFWILVDLTRRLMKSTWSEKQCAFAVNLVKAFTQAKENALRWHSEHEKLGDVEVGRYEIEGEVIKVSWKDTNYSYGGESTKKLTIKTPTGNVMYGTCPAAIFDVERGQHIIMTATVEGSKDDPKFGLWKRPSKARIIAEDEK